MTMRKKIAISSGAIVILASAGFFLLASRTSNNAVAPAVKVTRGTIIDKALAVGTIEPENEISIKSKVSGVVKKIYADAGTFVKAGQPLLEVRPDPTPLELADAKRQVQLEQNTIDNLKKERTREESLVAKQLISTKEYEDFQRQYQESELKLKIAKEHLALFESGKVKIDETEIES